MRRLAAVPLAAAAAAAAAACSPSARPPPVVYPSGSREVDLRVASRAGLLPPGGEFAIPMITVYGGGLIVEPSESRDSGQSGDSAVPAMKQRRLTAAGLGSLVEAAEKAHLREALDLGDPLANYAGVIVVTVAAQRRRTVTKLIAPDFRRWRAQRPPDRGAHAGAGFRAKPGPAR